MSALAHLMQFSCKRSSLSLFRKTPPIYSSNHVLPHWLRHCSFCLCNYSGALLRIRLLIVVCNCKLNFSLELTTFTVLFWEDKCFLFLLFSDQTNGITMLVSVFVLISMGYSSFYGEWKKQKEKEGVKMTNSCSAFLKCV